MVLAPLLDAVSILVFVVLGRRSHDETGGFATTLEIAAPFLVALTVSWLVLGVRRRPTDPRVGALLATTTVAVGQLLRNVAFERGTALAFVIVSLAMTNLLFVGWRLVANALRLRFARVTSE